MYYRCLDVTVVESLLETPDQVRLLTEPAATVRAELNISGGGGALAESLMGATIDVYDNNSKKQAGKKFNMPGHCRFNNAWLQMNKYSWVTADKDPGRAQCRLCGGKSIDISNMGEAALSSHAKGSKHQSAAASEATATPITGFFTTPRTTTTSSSTSLSSATKQASITDAVMKNDVLTAEIMWALKMVNSHYSFKSSEDASLLFRRMFPDSQIATQFACGERKCSYLC
ncbi:hypothetical protein N1851_006846 [Merluccius polli]|uniref:Uncharacterized protein n=1 Tax=Merluccius polli TaxID=89951 RepID=A0AA47N3R5_MERPO|nr:hypothetical protein N1851_006846 [Merluccius polli]